uniref:Scavenger receptor class B member 1 n=1 Tax=Steinernema glaseri TaxID=37863 RepID=A0A1I7ZBB1_9BILA
MLRNGCKQRYRRAWLPRAPYRRASPTDKDAAAFQSVSIISRRPMSRCLRVLGVLVVVGLFLAGLLLLIAFPLGILPAVIRQRLVLAPKSSGEYSTITGFWQKLPTQNHFDFYLFNVTNPDEVEFFGEKVSVIEFGPYSFIETEHKDDIVWQKDNTQVYFKNEKRYVWDPQRSCKRCSYYDEFVLPNSVYMAVSQKGKQYQMGPLKSLMLDLSLLMMGEYPYKKVTMRGALFEGYYDPMVAMMHSKFFQIDIPEFFNMTLEELMGFPMPDIKKAGYFPGLHWWGDDYANQIVGLTDGSFNKPFTKKTDTIRIFRSFSCRTFPLHFERETTVHGIDGYVFKISDDAYNTQLPINKGLVFDNKFNKNYFPEWPCHGKIAARPKNTSRCLHINCREPKNYCDGCCKGSLIDGRVILPPGLVELKCFPGKNERMPIPAMISPPHFVDSPPEVAHAINGLHPDRAKHSSGAFTLQPLTGNAIAVKFRLQVSIPVYQDYSLTSLHHMRSSLVPVLWVEVNADPADYAIDYLHTYTVVIPKAILGIGICFTGIPCILVGVVLCLRVHKHKRKEGAVLRVVHEQY